MAASPPPLNQGCPIQTNMLYLKQVIFSGISEHEFIQEELQHAESSSYI